VTARSAGWRKRHRIVVVLSLSFHCSPAWTAAGAPEPPQPGPLPEFWLLSGNDVYGIRDPSEHESDDFRTSQTSLGIRLGMHMSAAVDYSILTDRTRNTRLDELTATAGAVFAERRAADSSWFAIGLGGRFGGDFYGQRIQDSTHRIFPAEDFRLDYDDKDAEGLIYGVYERTWQVSVQAESELFSSNIVSDQRIESDLGLRGILQEQIFSGTCRQWLGLRLRLREGNALSATSASVARFERGAWLEYGFAYRNLSLSGFIEPLEHKAYGVIGVTVGTW
jgi:hypothetical protein